MRGRKKTRGARGRGGRGGRPEHAHALAFPQPRQLQPAHEHAAEELPAPRRQGEKVAPWAPIRLPRPSDRQERGPNRQNVGDIRLLTSHEIFIGYRITNYRVMVFWQRSYNPRSEPSEEKWCFERFLVPEDQLAAAGVTAGAIHPSERIRGDRFCGRYEFENGVDLTTISGHIGIAMLCNSPEHLSAIPAAIRELMRLRIQNQGWLYTDRVYEAPEVWTPRSVPREER